MVDPTIAQIAIKHLNRWYRSKSRPRGVIDYYHRGTRMSFNPTYRIVNGLIAFLMLAIGALLFLVPDLFAGKPVWQQWLVKLGWAGLIGVALLLLLQLAREFTVVNDDGLVKSNLLGRVTRLEWRDIMSFSYKVDESTVTFRNAARQKLTMSLCYDGWQDFLEMAQRRMEPGLFWQVNHGLATVKASDQRAMHPPKKPKTNWFGWKKKKI